MNREILSLAAVLVLTTSSNLLPAANAGGQTTSTANIGARGSGATAGNEQVKVTPSPTIALALAGGGIRGAAHIGVLRVLEREGIKVNSISGSSMGAVVGGLYAAGVPLDDIEQMLIEQSMQRSYLPRFSQVKIVLKQLVNLLPFVEQKYGGFFTGKKFEKYIADRLPENKKNIEDLDIRFTAVVTDLATGKTHRLSKGPLARAMLASSAIPPLIQPVEMENGLYVDGACLANLPCKAARETGADLVIAVASNEAISAMDAANFSSIGAITNRMTSLVLDGADEAHYKYADIVLKPEVTGIGIFSRRKEDTLKAIRAGELIAEKALPQLRTTIAHAALKKAHPIELRQALTGGGRLE